MADLLQSRIRALLDSRASPTLTGIRRGIEKESLRITPDGRLSQQPHPAALGSKLTNPWITTDYSEALLEFITPPTDCIDEPIHFLDDIHRFVYANIGEEILWVNSMPCLMGADEDIPIAHYGRSNVGLMKEIYRRGLGYRYGRAMQTIAGIHYNFSFPERFWTLHQQLEGDDGPLGEFIDRRYFDLLRNFQRYSWLLMYLFGASPAICPSFLQGREHDLLTLRGKSLYRPHATSLRMSDIGYQNNAQSSLHISYNSLDEYVDSLTRAIKTPDAEYEKLGVCVDGRYRQLNGNILQIENEYYSSIRPKRAINRGERPTLALARRGVEYIELRAVDLNPFEPVGIRQQDLRFFDLFATYCLLLDSPKLDSRDLEAAKSNIRKVVYDGRDPAVTLDNWGEQERLRDWAARKLTQMEPIAELFDGILGDGNYRDTLADQQAKVSDPECTPSARVLAEMERRQQGFFHFAMEQALQHRDHFLARPLPADRAETFERAARDSLAEQADWEAEPQKPFADYLADYFRD
jgi:glutamate--cysteine ligase